MFFKHIGAVGYFLIARVVLVGGHETMTVLKIIELGSLEYKVSGTKFIIMLFDPLPFVLVGGQRQDLKLNTNR